MKILYFIFIYIGFLNVSYCNLNNYENVDTLIVSNKYFFFKSNISKNSYIIQYVRNTIKNEDIKTDTSLFNMNINKIDLYYSDTFFVNNKRKYLIYLNDTFQYVSKKSYKKGDILIKYNYFQHFKYIYDFDFIIPYGTLKSNRNKIYIYLILRHEGVGNVQSSQCLTFYDKDFNEIATYYNNKLTIRDKYYEYTLDENFLGRVRLKDENYKIIDIKSLSEFTINDSLILKECKTENDISYECIFKKFKIKK